MNYHHGDLYNSLVSSGLALLEDEGMEALSLRKVAKKAGVSHAAPYRHFADKGALLVAIAEQGFVLLNEHMSAAGKRSGLTAKQKLAAALHDYLQFGRTHPRHVELMFGVTANTPPPELQTKALAAFNSFVTLVKETLAESKTRGDPQLLALALWTQVHGFLVLSPNVDFNVLVSSTNDPIETALSMTMRGLFK